MDLFYGGTMERVEIRLFGQMLVRRSDGSVVASGEWRTAKTVDLLRLLALDAGQPVPVHRIFDRLWPDVDVDRARASLRTAASQLRKVLQEDCLQRTAGALVLQGAWVDSVAYLQLLSDVKVARQAGDWVRLVELAKQAESLYLGDVEAPDSSGDWLHETAGHYSRLRGRLLLDAAQAAAALGWLRDSIELAEQANALEETEEAVRVLMRGYAATGEMRRAIEVYETLRRHLADGLGIDPAPQTRAVHLQLLTGTTVEEVPVEAVGQRPAVRGLAEAVRSLGGAGGVVWLVGPEGSGRDTVVEAACRRLDLSLHNMNQQPEWLRSATMPGGDDRNAASDPWDVPETDVLVMPRAAHVPRHARSVLHQLVRRNRQVVVVPVQRHMAVAGGPWVAGDGDAPERLVEVPTLDRAEVEQLATAVLQGRPAPALVDRLVDAAEGRAGDTCRAARRWLNEGRVIWTVGGLDLGAGSVDVPLSAPEQLRRALCSLSAVDADVLAVVALADRALDPAELSRVALLLHGCPVEEADLGRLVAEGLLSQDGDGYRLHPDRERQDLVDRLRPHVRRRLLRLLGDDSGKERRGASRAFVPTQRPQPLEGRVRPASAAQVSGAAFRQ